MSEERWNIRNAIESDISFVYSTWLRSYKGDSALGLSCKPTVYFLNYNRVIDWILSQEDTQILVACKPDEPEVIFGYLIYQPGVMHYAFTKEPFSRQGIARSLYRHADEPKTYTHKTFYIRPITEKHTELTFNPFLIFHQGEPLWPKQPKN